MPQELTPTERLAAEHLIIGIEVKPPPPKGMDWMIDRAFTLAKMALELGIPCVKVEALARAHPNIVDELRKLGLKVFLDLKLSGTKDTLAIDAILLKRSMPDLLSFMLKDLDPAAIESFHTELPDTKLLGVAILTNLNEKKFRQRNGCSIEEEAIRRGAVAREAKMHGLISAPGEAGALRRKFAHELPLYAPAIRPEGVVLRIDDQDPERAMTPTQAVKAGVKYLIVQRPITEAENPRDAAIKIIQEIAAVAYPKS